MNAYYGGHFREDRMADHCQIPNAIEKIMAASHCGCAYIGGSLTVGVGASNVAETSWRALFTRYLYRTYHPKYHCQVSEIMGAVGASESYASVFTLERNVMPAMPDLALVEECVNDSGAPDKNLVLKGMEGIVRQLLSVKGRCEVIIVGQGKADNSVDMSLHRQIADHYDLLFVDAQAYILETLKQRGQSWDAIAIEFEKGDVCHLNDYGNQLVFEAIRLRVEEQVKLYREGKRRERNPALPAPLLSDELQYTQLIDPSRPDDRIVLEGSWERKSRDLVPWYFDNLLVGKPGARMTLNFRGTAVALYGLMFNNGLKLEAELDGKEIPGAYLRHFIEFGKGTLLAHGLPAGEHVLRLTVGPPSQRHNKLDSPTAQVAYIGVACKPD
jgi:hypothetical protein